MAQQSSFLKQVAQAFYNNGKHNLRDYCFIFPNRRSSIFFEKELIACSDKEPFILPSITTISDFVCGITTIVECGRIEQLLDLYDEYCKLAGNNAEPFDEFSHWGEIILSDFNDIDLYLVDAEKIFTNIKEYKEIDTDYLTDEQKSALREYFGDAYPLNENDMSGFWKHTNAYNDSSKKDYFRLWEILGNLYKQFNSRLEAKGLAYSGHIYRKAVDILKSIKAEQLPFSQYVFVGFNVLSTSELQIFSILQNKGVADFYWDLNSPALRDRKNKASKFVSLNMSKFKPKLNIDEPVINSFPHIKVKAIPSNVGQVKYAAHIVETLISEGKVDNPNDLLDTAIVLPDENLFIPLSGSLSKEQIGDVNITMGFPIKKSLISNLLSSISKTHRQSRKIKGEYCYYIEDIKSLLAHPYLKLLTGNEINDLTNKLNKERLFFIPFSVLKETCPSLVELFLPITEMSVKELIKYTNNVLNFISSKVLTSLTDKNRGSIELTCLNKYIEQFRILADIIINYDIKLNDSTFFYLIDRFISGAIVSLQGEPLKGLQVMGVLETRCLDFKNIIILSMNEKVFPRKHFSRSFIPYTIRKGFSMATIEHQECMYAYYFYRMISRANNVFLLYDARSTALGSGDPSRYIQQLCKIYSESGAEIEHVPFEIRGIKELDIEVPKTERIMDSLNRYRTEGSGKFLSASSINSYLECPLKFYFGKVEGLYIQDEISEFMNHSTFGTIIHEIMLNIYSPYKNKLVTQEYINTYLKNEAHCLDRIIKCTVNKVFNGKGDDCYEELDGVGYMVEDVIKHFVIEILKFDAKQEFTYIQGEKEESGFWKELGINFRQFIDRVDMVKEHNGLDSYIRIIDYKTGKDDTTALTFNNAMKDSAKKAIIQIFLYCNYYNYLNNSNQKIKPLIYTVQDMSKAEIRINRNPVEDFNDFNEEFMELMKSKIEEMFDKNIPFKQTTNEDNCKYCKYKDFCRK